MNNNFCIDCKKVIISPNNFRYGKKRCLKCAANGKNNSNYNNKWTKKQKELQSIITKKAMNKLEIINKMKQNHADVLGKNNPMFGIHRFGKNSPCWIDGRSYSGYPQEWTNQLRESIRKRDNHTCQNCGMTEEEHLVIYSQVLHVHHIDYNKQNCKEDNLITLCFGCNIKANKNRNLWQDLFTNKLEK